MLKWLTNNVIFTFSFYPILDACRLPPGSVHAGETKDVVITLKDIDLTGVTGDINVAFGCAGVTVNSATVNSATEITANITVAETAQACTGDVTISGAGDIGIICRMHSR